jgi:hypothetical protein
MKSLRRSLRLFRKAAAAQRIPFYGVVSSNEPAVTALLPSPQSAMQVLRAFIARMPIGKKRS